MRPLDYRTTVLVTLSMLLAGPVLADCGPDIDLEGLLIANDKAMGGGERWAEIENVRYQLEVTEPGLEIAVVYWATREGNARIDFYAGSDRVFSQGQNGTQAWSQTKGGPPEELDDAGRRALRHGLELPGRFFTLSQAAERGAELSLVGCVQLDQQSLWQLDLELSDGFERSYFIDPQSLLAVAWRDQRPRSPDDPTVVTIYTRAEKLEITPIGVMASWRTVQTEAESGEWLGNTEVLSIEHNRELPDDLFSPKFRPEQLGPF